MAKWMSWLNRMSIAGRLLSALFASVFLIMGSLAWYNYLLARELFEQDVLDAARDAAVSAAERIEGKRKAAEQTAKGLAVALNYFQVRQEEPYHLLENVLQQNQDAFGAAIAFDSPVSGADRDYACPYVFRSQGRFMRMDLNRKDYRYQEREWYKQANRLGRAVWSEPYDDVGGGGILMTTYALPFHSPNGYAGVVTVDLSLQGLTDLLKTIPTGQAGYAFLVSPQNKYVGHTIAAEIMGDAIEKQLGKAVLFHGVYVTEYDSELSGKSGWLMTVPVSDTGWWLGIFFAQEDLLVRILHFSRVQFALGISGFALLVLIVTFVARGITRPLRKLEEAARQIAAGKLDTQIPMIAGEDEVARLSGAFRQMQLELLQYIERLSLTLQAKERIESELRIARAIQMSMVPKTFPPFPQLADVDVFAMIEPAKEVGGDFYNFCLLPERKLCLIIGDVSDKGMPAALFMAATQTLCRVMAANSAGPADLLRRVNEELLCENDMNMFVTLFCAWIDLDDGCCRYANAGHLLPFIAGKRRAVAQLPVVAGMALGMFEDVFLLEGEITLCPGDTMLLFTDGLSEAENQKKELYGLARTAATFSHCAASASQEIVETMRRSVLAYAGETAQSDDLAIVAFRFARPEIVTVEGGVKSVDEQRP